MTILSVVDTVAAKAEELSAEETRPKERAWNTIVMMVEGKARGSLNDVGFSARHLRAQ